MLQVLRSAVAPIPPIEVAEVFVRIVVNPELPGTSPEPDPEGEDQQEDEGSEHVVHSPLSTAAAMARLFTRKSLSVI